MLSSALFMAGGKKNDAWDTELESNAELLGAKALVCDVLRSLSFPAKQTGKKYRSSCLWCKQKQSKAVRLHFPQHSTMRIDIFHNYNETRATSEMNTAQRRVIEDCDYRECTSRPTLILQSTDFCLSKSNLWTGQNKAAVYRCFVLACLCF